MIPSALMQNGNKILVAMSGGVDSSVAACLLSQAGHDIFGVSMQVWDYRRHATCESKVSCCAPDDFTDARKVAAALSIPYYVFDFETIFEEAVIKPFVESYRNARTPNPCLDCNRKVKFGQLRDKARKFGATAVATGHYAVIEKREDGFHLLRGADSAKDQSYFLYSLTQEELSKTLFPVGHLSKSEVRKIAEENGLATAQKAESQDICFVSGKLGDFLKSMGVSDSPGAIITSSGKKVGQHQGIHSFTVGQRRGINVGGSDEPLYVIELRASDNTVVIGKKAELEKTSFRVNGVSFCHPAMSHSASAVFECLVQVRYRHKGVAAKVERKDDGSAFVTFKESWSAIAPGQAAVFYDLENREVLGGGTIEG